MPRFSMTTPAGHVFLAADYLRDKETFVVRCEDTVKVKDTEFTGKEFMTEFKKNYIGPQKLDLRVVKATPQGLPPAPDFKEARKDRYQPGS